MRTALVVGYGSIGARHARILRQLGLYVSVVSGRPIFDGPIYRDLTSALSAKATDYVVIANETARHIDTLESLGRLGFAGTVLIEKPLATSAVSIQAYPFRQLFVAYNLRFHPVLQALARYLANDRVITVQAYAGQYLPDWRPGTDYRTCYSAHKTQGGGVLRDLSHELDYLAWLFGPWKRIAALGGRLGDLEIDSDDAWVVLLEMARCPAVSLQVNYLDRTTRREITVIGASRTYKGDLIAGSLEVNGALESFSLERDMTYREQHRAVIEGRTDQLCGLEDGIAVMELIAGIERSAERGEWIVR